MIALNFLRTCVIDLLLNAGIIAKFLAYTSKWNKYQADSSMSFTNSKTPIEFVNTAEILLNLTALNSKRGKSLKCTPRLLFL